MSSQNIKGAAEMEAALLKAIDYIKNDVPIVIGQLAVDHFKEAFRKGGLANTKWESRKTPRAGSTNAQGVLVLSGDLMESIDYRIQGSTIIIYSDLLYAEIHNEGGEITVSVKMKKFFWAKHYEMKDAGNLDLAELYKRCALAKKIVIPKRQFIGPDPELDQQVVDKITKDLDNIFNS
ncbi:phage virion morphogenesis protein [Niabella insulamsoli]|uniref:phage virion morphogenesis protein n=1 Tax=Niabella insulamsoli TaxID=3144874 RepID=UPI0031FC63C9